MFSFSLFVLVFFFRFSFRLAAIKVANGSYRRLKLAAVNVDDRLVNKYRKQKKKENECSRVMNAKAYCVCAVQSRLLLLLLLAENDLECRGVSYMGNCASHKYFDSHLTIRAVQNPNAENKIRRIAKEKIEEIKSK